MRQFESDSIALVTTRTRQAPLWSSEGIDMIWTDERLALEVAKTQGEYEEGAARGVEEMLQYLNDFANEF